MKKILAVMIFVVVTVASSHAQNVNWRSLGENQSSLIQFDLGYDYGVTTQIGYSRHFSWFRPVVLGLEYSFPMGKDLIDDFKVRVGGQVEVLQMDEFSATVRIQSVFRRYQNQLVRILSFGSDFALVTGYYKPSWYGAAEVGFDKSIVSHLKHTDIMKDNFPTIRDGWYIPSGGHYYYGIQAGKTLGEVFDLSLRLGATKAQARDEDAVIPFYGEIGLSLRF
jgi:hypothetical protein